MMELFIEWKKQEISPHIYHRQLTSKELETIPKHIHAHQVYT